MKPFLNEELRESIDQCQGVFTTSSGLSCSSSAIWGPRLITSSALASAFGGILSSDLLNGSQIHHQIKVLSAARGELGGLAPLRILST